MTNLGLSVSDIVNVQIAMSPRAAQERNFGSLLIVGDSAVVDIQERMRLYTSIDSIAADFGTAAPEYLAALLYFSQSPQPLNCYVGRWARTATHGTLRGGLLSATQQLIANFTSISDGGMNITVDGVVRNLTSLDFTDETNLNGVASIIQTALSTAATVTWDANNVRFVVKAVSSGPTSGVSFATAPASGTDISAMLGLRSTSGGYSVAGINSETLLAAVQKFGGMSNDWYGLQIAASVIPSTLEYTAIAAYIEAAGVSRIFGATTQEAGALDATITDDLASALAALGYKRTFVQYSSSSPYASASIFGRAFTVNFDGSNTTITLKFKQEPGVAPETLTETQAAALAAKNCNVFVKYNNNTAILQQGVMSNGFFFDEVHGTDWLQNDLQTDVYNLLYTSATKIPQTDSGINQIVARISARLEQAVVNGLVAPGVWNAPGFGALNTGDTLSKGYYVFAPPIVTQSQADREARKAPAIQAAIKLAGAVHSSNIVVNVNR
jgi:hypothetical protein